MEIIQEVGSYAGFAAVVGLAVLSALYFSQARDLRRLREWAGRAPERAAEQATQVPEQAAQQATRPVPTGAVKPIPGKATPAPAAAAGAGPATAVQPATPGAPAKPGQPGAPAKPGQPAAPAKPGAPPVPATAAGQVPAQAVGNSGQTTPGQPAPVPAAAGASAPPAAKPGAPAPSTPAAAPAKPGVPPAPAKPGTPPPAVGKPPAVTPPRPPLPGRAPGAPVPRPAAASSASQATAVLPASQRLRETPASGRKESDGLPNRYLALIVAGVIVVGGGLAFGVSKLGDDDGGSSGGGEEQAQEPESTAPINPSTVTVSVLNGTTVPGLAAQIGDEVESAGFQRGNVANAIDQQRAESVVLFAEGADREARLVARRLNISQIEPVDPDSQALAGNASVVVIVGGDRTQ